MVNFLGQPEFTDSYFWRKLTLFHVLGTANDAKLKFSQESPLDKSQRYPILADASRKNFWSVKCAWSYGMV